MRTPGLRSRRTCSRSTDNLTHIRGDHAYKFGFDMQHVADTRTRTASQLYTFPTSPLSRRAQRHEPLRLHDVHAVLRRAEPRIQLESLRLLRAGRLAPVVRHQASLRPPLRPLRRAGRQPRRAVRGLARLPRRQEQLGAARRPRVDAWRRPPHGDPRQHRPDVRPGAPRDVRAVADQRRHEPPRRGVVPADDAGAPAFPGRAVERCRRAAEHADHGVAGLRDRARCGRTTCSSSISSAISYAMAVGTLVHARLQPAGHQQHQPDQSDRAACGRPADLQHRDQRQHPARSALQRDQHGRVARRVRPTRT